MCKIRYTSSLHTALGHVFDGKVIYQPGNSGPMAGFYWQGDGHMTQAELDDLASLVAARLIAVGPPPICRRDGNPVQVTAEGASRLPEWDARVARIDDSLRVLGDAA